MESAKPKICNIWPFAEKVCPTAPEQFSQQLCCFLKLNLTRIPNIHTKQIKSQMLLELHFFFLIFFSLSFFFFNFIFKLYITVLVLPNIKMNPPQVYMCSPS